MRNYLCQGTLDEKDVACISCIPEACPEAEQILVTGEIAQNRLGDYNAALLCIFNNITNSPLYLVTDRRTIIMTRYDPQTIWNNIPSKRLSMLFMDECRRLGVKYWSTQFSSFYEGVFESNKMFGKYVITDNYNDSLFINAILLFRKSCAYGIRMSQFFSDFSFENVKLHSLTNEQETRLHEVWSANEELLTNDEIFFLDELYHDEKHEQKIIHFPPVAKTPLSQKKAIL